ncbi:abl interactor 2 isoform X2 [Lingula anatina]|uniref:Abl interactor 2 isoform X2 n=1 Tax=Lingula anatina TaxID=7574 RepID=A0A1S3H4V7_LINAN|nr:abl interactor 2 isoform X2 [Lingula anatina]|eukprot:XP_013380169.1 abl interactor 2 isoform X2 [Lingula anatina]
MADSEQSLWHLTEHEIPEGRRQLQESHVNLERVADYCEGNYIQAEDKRHALEETKNYTTQSLASVAYQINNLAANFLSLLEMQTQQLANMESGINHLSEIVMIHKEKVARREIGVLTTNKCITRPVGVKNGIVFPEQPERPVKYRREDINFSLLDDIGHGVRVQQNNPRSKRSNSMTSKSSQGSSSAPTTKPPTPPLTASVQGGGTIGRREGAQYRQTGPALVQKVATPSVPSHYAPSYPMTQPSHIPQNDVPHSRQSSGYRSAGYRVTQQMGVPPPPPPNQVGGMGHPPQGPPHAGAGHPPMGVAHPMTQQNHTHIPPPPQMTVGYSHGMGLPPPSPGQMSPPPPPPPISGNMGPYTADLAEPPPPPPPAMGFENGPAGNITSDLPPLLEHEEEEDEESCSSSLASENSSEATLSDALDELDEEQHNDVGQNQVEPPSWTYPMNSEEVELEDPTFLPPPVEADNCAMDDIDEEPTSPPPPELESENCIIEEEKEDLPLPPPPFGANCTMISDSTQDLTLLPQTADNDNGAACELAEEGPVDLPPPPTHNGYASPEEYMQDTITLPPPEYYELEEIAPVSPDLPPPPPEQSQMAGGNYDDYSPPPPPPNFIDQNGQHEEEEVQEGPDDWIPKSYLEKVIAVYDYAQERDDELSFNENAMIYVVKKNDDGWWEGVFNGMTGLFPSNYVEPCI